MGSNNGGGRKPSSLTVNDRAMTLQEIADILGTSRERVRQIEAHALGKVRRLLLAQGYNADDFIGQMIDTPAKPSNIRNE